MGIKLTVKVVHMKIKFQKKRSEDIKTADIQIDRSIDQNANDLNKTPSRKIPKKDNNETFHIDNSTQMSIAGLIISIFILVLIWGFII